MKDGKQTETAKNAEEKAIAKSPAPQTREGETDCCGMRSGMFSATLKRKIKGLSCRIIIDLTCWRNKKNLPS